MTWGELLLEMLSTEAEEPTNHNEKPFEYDSQQFIISDGVEGRIGILLHLFDFH